MTLSGRLYACAEKLEAALVQFREIAVDLASKGD